MWAAAERQREEQHAPTSNRQEVQEQQLIAVRLLIMEISKEEQQMRVQAAG